MVEQELVQRVKQMRGQGYQNSQIIDILQRDGNNSSDIFDAINQSMIGDGGPQKQATSNVDLPPPPAFNAPQSTPGTPPAPQAPPAPSTSAPQRQDATPEDLTGAPAPEPLPSLPDPIPAPSMDAPPRQSPRMSSPEPVPSAPPRHASHTRTPMTPTTDVSTEEYIEAIIDEKWVELEDDIQKVIDWKNRSEQRITQLSQEVVDLKDRFEKLHAALIGKIDSYDKNILEVGAEIKAMEKVFSKVLPVFTDNVKQLQDITDDLGKKRK